MINTRNISPFIAVGILNLNEFASEHSNMSKRELEKAGSKFLLTQMLKTEAFELNYTAEKKPFLNARTEHISISHSHDKLAVIINQKENTGIDIELIRDKFLKIQHKFLNQNEINFTKNNIEKLITVWAAKEAMYKVYGLKELDFKRNLFVEEFDGAVIFGKIDIGSFKKRYQLVCENVDDYKMVYVLNEI